MSFFKSEQHPSYQPIEDENCEDDRSDITKVSPITPLSRSDSPCIWCKSHRSSISRYETSNLWKWIRWGLVVILQLVIILGLALLQWDPQGKSMEKNGQPDGPPVETGDDINGLYKTGSHSYSYLTFDTGKFVPNMTSNDNRADVRRNWDLLMPLGSGSVAIPEYRNHPLLGKPLTDDPIRSGPLFEASWTHALHCLYYSVDSYHQLIVNGRTPDDNPTHAAHCFEYLRTSILCNLDMTLEGALSTDHDVRGQPHVCRNREDAVKWIEERRVDDLRDIVGP